MGSACCCGQIVEVRDDGEQLLVPDTCPDCGARLEWATWTTATGERGAVLTQCFPRDAVAERVT